MVRRSPRRRDHLSGRARNILAGLALGASLLATTHAMAQTADNTQWIKANGVNLRYQIAGPDRDPILFVHEMTMTMESWDDLFPLYAKSHRVVRFDMRGWGLSEKTAGPLAMEQPAEDIRGLLDALGIRRPVIVVAGGAGANVALLFAAKYPERVKGLATFSAAIDLEPPPAKSAAAAAPSADPYELVYPAVLRTDPRKWRRFVGINKAGDTETLRSWAKMVASFDLVPVLPQITAPTLVAGTSLYTRRSMANMKAIADAIPNGRFVELRTGHFAALESPELVVPALDRFLEDLDNAAPERGASATRSGDLLFFTSKDAARHAGATFHVNF